MHVQKISPKKTIYFPSSDLVFLLEAEGWLCFYNINVLNTNSGKINADWVYLTVNLVADKQTPESQTKLSA